MRTFLVILMLIFFVFPEINSVAGELFLVRVISVDQESGEISAEVIDDPDLSVNSPCNRACQKFESAGGCPMNKPGMITVFMASGGLPKHLHPGLILRAWGKFSKETGTFIARKLLPEKTSGCGIDHTGVRRRLRKGRGCGGKGRGGGYGRK